MSTVANSTTATYARSPRGRDHRRQRRGSTRFTAWHPPSRKTVTVIRDRHSVVLRSGETKITFHSHTEAHHDQAQRVPPHRPSLRVAPRRPSQRVALTAYPGAGVG